MIKSKKIIYAPFAYEYGKNSGENISGDALKKIETYLKNACVALASAKHYNPDCIVAFVTNLNSADIPNEITSIFSNYNIETIYVPYNDFLFKKDYPWSLAFYKLCALKAISNMDYDYISYFDTDVFVQGSFDAIWNESEQNILLYDIVHGLNTKDYKIICDEFKSFLNSSQYVTHYGGEFFAGKKELTQKFVKELEIIYQEMIKRNILTTKGDEFITSLAAFNMKNEIKNAAPYIFRFWTAPSFRLISTSYKYNRITILHVPNEKAKGMLKLYGKYIKKGTIPKDKCVWRALRLSGNSLKDKLYTFVKEKLIRFIK